MDGPARQGQCSARYQPMSWQLRPGIKIARPHVQPGRRECVVSRNVARRFENCRHGQRFRPARAIGKSWESSTRKGPPTIRNWVDADEAREAFNRSSTDRSSAAPSMRSRRPRLIRRSRTTNKCSSARSRDGILPPADQTARRSNFSARAWRDHELGAAFSAMNHVRRGGSRAREIGTLRVLGSGPGASMSPSCWNPGGGRDGGVLGCVLPCHCTASQRHVQLDHLRRGRFRMPHHAGLLLGGMLFALIMGAVGGSSQRWLRKARARALRSHRELPAHSSHDQREEHSAQQQFPR